MVDKFGTNKASYDENVDIEMERKRERYRFPCWGQTV
jgi:aconitase A